MKRVRSKNDSAKKNKKRDRQQNYTPADIDAIQKQSTLVEFDSTSPADGKSAPPPTGTPVKPHKLGERLLEVTSFASGAAKRIALHVVFCAVPTLSHHWDPTQTRVIPAATPDQPKQSLTRLAKPVKPDYESYFVSDWNSFVAVVDFGMEFLGAVPSATSPKFAKHFVDEKKLKHHIRAVTMEGLAVCENEVQWRWAVEHAIGAQDILGELKIVVVVGDGRMRSDGMIFEF